MRRFSIGSLILVVLVCGVAAAALRDASSLWAETMVSLTLLLLAVAVLAAWNRHGAARAFWQGFAFFGWAYLVLIFGEWVHEYIRPPTEPLLLYVHEWISPPQAIPGIPGGVVTGPNLTWPNPMPFTVPDVVGAPPGQPDVATMWVPMTPGAPAPVVVPVDQEQFLRIGHCLIALLAATAGGLIARWLHRTDPGPAAAG